MYRTVATISDSIRFAATVTGENDSAARPALSYEPRATASHVFVNTALLHYRAGESVDIAVGRDQLPTGINIPDLGAFVKARNRLGYYDAPTQLKAVWGGTRFQVMPFVYAGRRERAEKRTRARCRIARRVRRPRRPADGSRCDGAACVRGQRRPTARWKLRTAWLRQMGHSRRARCDESPPRRSHFEETFRQDASYAQVFWAVRDWLVTSATGERLRVNAPYTEHLTAGKIEVASRISSRATVIVGTRVEHNAANRRLSRSVAVQLALKTVD